MATTLSWRAILQAYLVLAMLGALRGWYLIEHDPTFTERDTTRVVLLCALFSPILIPVLVFQSLRFNSEWDV